MDHTGVYQAQSADVGIDVEVAEFSDFFVGIVVLFVLALLGHELIDQFDIDPRGVAVSWGSLVLMAMPLLYATRRYRKHLVGHGLCVGPIRRTLAQVAVIWLALALAIRALSWLGHICFGWPQLTFDLLLVYIDLTRLPEHLLYFTHCFAQETLVCGLLLSSFTRLMGPRGPVFAVAMTATMFSLAHLHLGWMAVLMTWLTGILFGSVYHYQRNLLGVSLVHWFMGIGLFNSGILAATAWV